MNMENHFSRTGAYLGGSYEREAYQKGREAGSSYVGPEFEVEKPRVIDAARAVRRAAVEEHGREIGHTACTVEFHIGVLEAIIERLQTENIQLELNSING